MKTFIISSDKAKREIVKKAETLRDAITWAQNNCDLSFEPWEVREVKDYQGY